MIRLCQDFFVANFFKPSFAHLCLDNVKKSIRARFRTEPISERLCLSNQLGYPTQLGDPNIVFNLNILEDFENASPYVCTFLANRICD